MVGWFVWGVGGYEEGTGERSDFGVDFWGEKGCGWWKKRAALGDAALV